jgi:hypothetical protein
MTQRPTSAACWKDWISVVGGRAVRHSISCEIFAHASKLSALCVVYSPCNNVLFSSSHSFSICADPFSSSSAYVCLFFLSCLVTSFYCHPSSFPYLSSFHCPPSVINVLYLLCFFCFLCHLSALYNICSVRRVNPLKPKLV